MNKPKIKRQSFSSPAQLQKMATMVLFRWQEVWTEAFGRHQTAQKGRKSSSIKVLIYIPPKSS